MTAIEPRRVLAGAGEKGALAAVLAVGALLRVLALQKPLYIDEIVTVTVATAPLDAMPSVMRQIDASPALFPLILHGWLAIIDTDVWARLLPALIGVAAVAMVFVLARRAFGVRTGIAAAFVFAIAPPQVHYAQYVRSYSLFTLLSLVYVWLALRWLQDSGRGRLRDVLVVTAVVTALLYTHYLSMLVAVGPCAALAWYLRATPGRVAAFASAHVLAGLLFLPGVPLLQHNMAADRVRNVDRPAPPPAVVLVPNLVAELSVGQRALGFSDATARRLVLGAAALTFPVLLALGVRAGWRGDRAATVLLLSLALVPLVIYLGAGRRLIAVRFFLPSAAAYAVLVAHGLASLRAWRAAVAGLAVTLLAVVPLAHFYTVFEWSYPHALVAREMLARAKPGDLLLVVHPFEAFYYRRYLDGRLPVTGLVFTPLVDQPGYVIKPPALRADAAREVVRREAARHGRLWIVGQSTRSFASSDVEEQRLLQWMDAELGRVETLDGLTGGDPAVRLYRGAPSPRP